MRKLFIAAAAAVGSVVIAAPAIAAPPLGITSLSLKTTHGETDLTVRGVCPNDPPDTLFITGDLGAGNVLLGSESITCDRSKQTFVLPLNTVLPRRTVVTDVRVSISGDGGEVNGFADRLVVK